MKNEELIECIQNFITEFWKNSKVNKFSKIPDFVSDGLAQEVHNGCNPNEEEFSKLYLILFKYNGTGYMDVMKYKNTYNRENKNDRQWLKEAVGFAVDRQKLRVNEKNYVSDLHLFEIFFEPNSAKGYAIPMVKNPPIDSLDSVYL